MNDIVLGIETSCDETAVAIYADNGGLLAHHVYSQIDLHKVYGGVVPELASRDHIRKAITLVDACLKDASLKRSDLSAVAYTMGPGLIGALMVGASVGRSLAWALDIPGIAVHHMEAHLMAAFLEEEKPEYPFVALLVSGGHTMLVEVSGFGKYRMLGESVDDAAGEAFDKTAKLLGLPYPGGAALAELAKKGEPSRFNFPRPMLNRPGLDFSFSGLKTAAVNAFHVNENTPNVRADIACAFQEAVVDTLVRKCKRALEQTHLSRLVVVGGVSANILLREKMKHMTGELDASIHYPRHEFCTDNGAMVAYTGFLRFQKKQFAPLAFNVKTRIPLE